MLHNEGLVSHAVSNLVLPCFATTKTPPVPCKAEKCQEKKSRNIDTWMFRRLISLGWQTKVDAFSTFFGRQEILGPEQCTSIPDPQ